MTAAWPRLSVYLTPLERMLLALDLASNSRIIRHISQAIGPCCRSKATPGLRIPKAAERTAKANRSLTRPRVM